jgi:hypothetical protein
VIPSRTTRSPRSTTTGCTTAGSHCIARPGVRPPADQLPQPGVHRGAWGPRQPAPGAPRAPEEPVPVLRRRPAPDRGDR